MIFIGVLSTSNASLEAGEVAELARLVSRDEHDRREQFVSRQFAMVYVNPGLSRGCISMARGDHSVALVSGRPLFDAVDGNEDQSAVDEIRQAFDRGDHHSLLRSSRGSFCGAHFNESTRRLSVFVDKVGVIPLYYGVAPGRVYFATALRMLEGLARLRRTISVEGMAELLSFGCCLGRKTPYEEISLLYSGEMVEVSASGLRASRYWRWDDVRSGNYLSRDSLVAEIDAHFEEAVRLRSGNANRQLAFLSGGLDSRAVTATLRRLRKDVSTLNFAPHGTEDAVFGSMASRALGTSHFHRPADEKGVLAAGQAIVQAWRQDHPGMLEKSSGWVWSGEGGSVGMGHVYLDENLVSIARSGDLAAVCRHFIESGGRRPPAGIFSSSVRAEVIQAPYDGLMAELTALHPNDPGKVPLLFLLHNDQRRHLSEYFENLDQVRFELALPFFDARVLETIIRAPIDWFLRHRLYNQWLTVFGDELSRTPWQVYPGHEGPVNTAAVPGLRNQWEDGWLDREQLRRRARSFLPKTLALLNGTDFPDNVLSRARLWMAYLATKIGAKDYGYALNAALIVHRYAACSNVRDANV